jgi:hypothetical protein
MQSTGLQDFGVHFKCGFGQCWNPSMSEDCGPCLLPSHSGCSWCRGSAVMLHLSDPASASLLKQVSPLWRPLPALKAGLVHHSRGPGSRTTAAAVCALVYLTSLQPCFFPVSLYTFPCSCASAVCSNSGSAFHLAFSFYTGVWVSCCNPDLCLNVQFSPRLPHGG